MATGMTAEQQESFMRAFQKVAKDFSDWFEKVRVVVNRAFASMGIYTDAHRAVVRRIHKQYRHKKRGKW